MSSAISHPRWRKRSRRGDRRYARQEYDPFLRSLPAPEARRLVERFEWHYTPKHGSWLDMAESELGVLASQCLNRRIADKTILAREVNAWQTTETSTRPRPTGNSKPPTPASS
jgi:hypothetical protein